MLSRLVSNVFLILLLQALSVFILSMIAVAVFLIALLTGAI